MAICEHAEKIKQNPDKSWGMQQLAYHHARCILCSLIEESEINGGLSQDRIRELGLSITEKPKDAMAGIPKRSVVIYRGQKLPVASQET